MRTSCVWFPGWSLDRPDAPPDRAVLVVGSPSAGGGQRVVAARGCSDVRPGMPRREAEGLCPGAVVLARDLGEEARRFEPVVAAIEEVVPRVEVVEPGMLLVPLAGALAYYGGEREIVETILGKLRMMPQEPATDVRLGVADGPFAATWAARTAEPWTPALVEDTSSFLASLDVGALLGTLDGGAADAVEALVATFRWLGVSTLGSLAGLPREAVSSRFGRAGLDAHRLAAGEDRMVDPRRIPPELAVEARYEDPLEMADQVAFAARALAASLMAGMRREGIAPHRVSVEVESATGEVRHRVWRSGDPFDERSLADRVWWQLRAWIEGTGVPGGIVRLRLDPSDLSGDGRQLALFEDVVAREEADRALARAQALVGPDGVLGAVPQGGRMPGERVLWVRWGEEPGVPERDPVAPWPGATPGPEPALVPPRPPVLEVEWDGGIPVRVRLGSRWEPVHSWSGPWRLTGRWWAGEEPADRYQLVTAAGAFLCVVRDGRVHLAGIYD